MFRQRSRFGFVVLVWMVTTSTEAATLEIAYESLERMIVARMMTQGGRYYMEGDPSSTCAYSFVQEPRVDGVEGRLRIRFLYAGRAGKEIAGKCVGPGDNFDLEITGIPTYRQEEGMLFLDDLKIRAPETAYFKIVAPLIERSLRRDLHYPLKDRLDYAAAWITSKGTSGTLSMSSFTVNGIKLGEDSIVVQIDFGLSIRP